MRFSSSKMSLIPGISLLVILQAASIVMSQTSEISTATPGSQGPGGSVRFGLALPRVSLIGVNGNTISEATSLRKTVGSYLTGPRIGTIDLKARLDSLALEEAQERQCDYVLYVSLVRTKQQPSTGGTSSGTRAGEEFTFEYKLVSTDGMQRLATNVATAKVKMDGEDVLTPMIESAAESVVAIARKAKPAPPQTITMGTQNADIPDAHPAATPSETGKRTPTGYDLLTSSPSRTRTPVNVTDPPKAEGGIRIGIVIPRVTLMGGSGVGNNESLALRETLKSYLGGSNLETLDLKARLDSLALTEGRNRQCDYVLYLSLVRKRQPSSSRSGGLPKIMGTLGGSGVGSKVPGAKASQEVSKGVASVSGTLAALGRAKDEVTFEYKLMPSNGGSPAATNVTKAKIKSDGEDVLTPMIETAAQAIVDATKKN